MLNRRLPFNVFPEYAHCKLLKRRCEIYRYDYIYYNKLVYKHVKRKVSGYFQWLVNRWMIQSEEKYF